MEEKQLLIIGIDPGTTLGYSVLDINGNIIEVNSSKLFDFNSLVTRLTRFGKVAIVGTDKKKAPSLVGRLKRKLGAKLITPSEDLKVKEKSKLVLGCSVRNTHERDALSSAIFSYKQLKTLFDRVDSFLDSCNKKKYSNRIKELLLMKDSLNISSALELAEGKVKKQVRKLPKKEIKIVEKKEDYKALKEKYSKLGKDFSLLRKYTDTLRMQLIKFSNNLKKEKPGFSPDKKTKELLDFKEKTIKNLNSQIESVQKENNLIKKEVNQLQSFLSDINGNIVMKKLKTLSWDEFTRKNKLLNIKQDDIILVENPNIVSNKTLDYLRELVNIIVCKNNISQKLRDESGFIFINSKELKIAENELFGLVNKKMFDKIKNNKSLLSTIIKEYRNKKEEN